MRNGQREWIGDAQATWSSRPGERHLPSKLDRHSMAKVSSSSSRFTSSQNLDCGCDCVGGWDWDSDACLTHRIHPTSQEGMSLWPNCLTISTSIWWSTLRKTVTDMSKTIDMSSSDSPSAPCNCGWWAVWRSKAYWELSLQPFRMHWEEDVERSDSCELATGEALSWEFTVYWQGESILKMI